MVRTSSVTVASMVVFGVDCASHPGEKKFDVFVRCAVEL